MKSPILTVHGSQLIEESTIFACTHCLTPMAYVRLLGGDVALECGNRRCGWTCGLAVLEACAIQGDGDAAPGMRICLSCTLGTPAQGLRLCNTCRQEAARLLYAAACVSCGDAVACPGLCPACQEGGETLEPVPAMAGATLGRAA